MGAAPQRISRKYISLSEAALMLGVTDRTVRNAVADGRLQGYRLGRTIRLRLDEIEDALTPFGGAA